jgi:hypothetical protein
MRVHALILALVSGCSLYFPDNPRPDLPPDAGQVRDAWLPDAGPRPDGGPAGAQLARCEDGQLYAVPVPGFLEEPLGHGAGRVFGRCVNGCRSAAVECTTSSCRDAIETLCQAPVSLGASCPLAGLSCNVSDAVIGCPETTACGMAVPGSVCQCTTGSYRCMTLTRAANIQAQLVGKWRGTVTTPGFAPPYPITLWIYPDGTYWPEAPDPDRTAFYYGGDGPSPRRKLTVLSTSDTAGSWADLAIEFGIGSVQIAELNALTVDDTTLRFTYIPAWSECGRSFDVLLTRY